MAQTPAKRSATPPPASPLALDDLRTFVRVAELQSFRAAAEALGVPKSTVSRRVSALEARLATRLLQRTTRKIALTDAGVELLRRSAPAVAVLEEAGRAVSEHGDAPRGRLRVSAAVTFGERFLGPVIAEYMRAYPEIEVDLVLTDRHVDLVEEGFDMAFRAGTLPDSSLVAREIGRSALRCFASPAYLRDAGRPKKPADLAGHACIVYRPLAPRGKWTFVVGGRARHQPIHARTTVDSLVLASELATAGLGIARLPEMFGLEGVERGELEEVLAPFAPPPSALHVVFPSGRLVPPRARAFVELAMRMLSSLRLGQRSARRAIAAKTR